jgi:hypothetical protein
MTNAERNGPLIRSLRLLFQPRLWYSKTMQKRVVAKLRRQITKIFLI